MFFESLLGSEPVVWHFAFMSKLTIALPDNLDAMLDERAKASGAGSKEDYLVALVESDCAIGDLERVLVERLGGRFAPLEADWKDKVRKSASKRLSA
jgi:hypothetical protein